MLEPIIRFILVLRNHNKCRWTNRSWRRCGVKLRGLLFTLPLESLYEKKGSQDKADHVASFENSDWSKPQRRRFNDGGVGSLEWHNYNKFELATRGKFQILLNNNLPLNPALLVLHAFWCTCYPRLIYVEDNVKKLGVPRKLFPICSFLGV